MNQKSSPDRRIQRTRELLMKALISLILEKGYVDITVQDIIDRANVGRSTFYSHFQDKEGLLLSGFENLREVFDDFRTQSFPGKSPWDISLALFQHAEEQRLVFKALFGEQAGAVVIKNMQKTMTAYLLEHFRANFSKSEMPDIPVDILVQYFVSTFLGLLTWWLDHELGYSANQMNEYFRKLTEPTFSGLRRGG